MNTNHTPATPSIYLKVESGETEKTEYSFKRSFKIGRDDSCEVQLSNPQISRFHTEVFLKHGKWWIRDLNSSNGTFVNGNRINEIPIKDALTVDLGIGAATLSFHLEEISPHQITIQQLKPSLTQYMDHYFGDTDADKMGDHTRMIRSAFEEIKKKHVTKYYYIIAVICVLFIIVGFYAFQKHQQVERQRLLAENIFYSMKTLELELASMQKLAEVENDAETLRQIAQYKLRQQDLANNYDKFLLELEVYDEFKLGGTDQIILKVARMFGECELNVPKDFVGEVKKYIERWQATNRFENALNRAVHNGWVEEISKIMLEHDLPPQFFYLALQESDFRARTVGPRTKYGIAKGVWQFMPQTALRYGLQTGPLVEIEKFDPRDDRFQFEKATRAAALYIRDLYDTQAQASGLLVMASYNWGERKVIDLINKLPENPKDRNFWQLLRKYHQYIPLETYNYVFYIISAAVIGENPRMFGFDFDNPLEPYTQDFFAVQSYN